MRLESCRTIIDSFSPNNILVIQIETSGPDVNTDRILRLAACSMNGDQIIATNSISEEAAEIERIINGYNVIIGVDVFDKLIPFLNKSGIEINSSIAADLQNEWNEIIGVYNSNTKEWYEISLASLAGTFRFQPHPELYSHEYNKVMAYSFLAEKAADFGTITLRTNRRTQYQIYSRAQNNLNKEHTSF